MAKAYIATFDLDPGAPGPSVGDVILSAYPGAMQITPTSYVLATDEQPKDVYDRVKPELDGYHKIYIVALECPYFGCGPADLNQWFTDNVKW